MSDDGRNRTSVSFVNQQTVAVDEQKLIDVALRTARSHGAVGEISLVLTDKASIAELNSKHLNGDGPTDVLAFPIDGLVSHPSGGPVLIGEVVLCPEVAVDQAPEDPRAEMELLVAHGVLHLLGHDHDDPARTRLMRAAEEKVVGRAGARFE